MIKAHSGRISLSATDDNWVFSSLSELRSWWEVPSIAHFCSLFRDAFGLLDFEIDVRWLYLPVLLLQLANSIDFQSISINPYSWSASMEAIWSYDHDKSCLGWSVTGFFASFGSLVYICNTAVPGCKIRSSIHSLWLSQTLTITHTFTLWWLPNITNI